jgi:hypothetical protein
MEDTLRKNFIIFSVLLFAVACSSTRMTGSAVIVVQDTLKSPATAKFNSSDIVIRDGQTGVVTVDYEAQNSFGAMLRSQACVCVVLPNNQDTFSSFFPINFLS